MRLSRKIINLASQFGSLYSKTSAAISNTIFWPISAAANYFSTSYDKYLEKLLSTKSFYLFTENDCSILGNLVYHKDHWLLVIYNPHKKKKKFTVIEDPTPAGNEPSLQFQQSIKNYWRSLKISRISFYSLISKFDNDFSKLEKIKARLKEESALSIGKEKINLGGREFTGKYAQYYLDLFLQSTFLYVSDQELFPSSLSSRLVKLLVLPLSMLAAFQRQRLLKYGETGPALAAAGGIMLSRFIEPVGASFNCTKILASYQVVQNRYLCSPEDVVLGNIELNPTVYNQSLQIYQTQTRPIDDCSSLRNDGLQDCNGLIAALISCGLSKQQALTMLYDRSNLGIQTCYALFPNVVMSAAHCDRLTQSLMDMLVDLSFKTTLNTTSLASNFIFLNNSLSNLQTSTSGQASSLLSLSSAVQALDLQVKKLVEIATQAQTDAKSAQDSSAGAQDTQLISVLTAIFLLILLVFQLKGFLEDSWDVIKLYLQNTNMLELKLKLAAKKLANLKKRHDSILEKSSWPQKASVPYLIPSDKRVNPLLPIMPDMEGQESYPLPALQQKLVDSFLVYSRTLLSVEKALESLSSIILNKESFKEIDFKEFIKDSKKQLHRLNDMRKVLKKALNCLERLLKMQAKVSETAPEKLLTEYNKLAKRVHYLCDVTIAMLLKKFKKQLEPVEKLLEKFKLQVDSIKMTSSASLEKNPSDNTMVQLLHTLIGAKDQATVLMQVGFANIDSIHRQLIELLEIMKQENPTHLANSVPDFNENITSTEKPLQIQPPFTKGNLAEKKDNKTETGSYGKITQSFTDPTTKQAPSQNRTSEPPVNEAQKSQNQRLNSDIVIEELMVSASPVASATHSKRPEASNNHAQVYPAPSIVKQASTRSGTQQNTQKKPTDAGIEIASASKASSNKREQLSSRDSQGALDLPLLQADAVALEPQAKADNTSTTQSLPAPETTPTHPKLQEAGFATSAQLFQHVSQRLQEAAKGKSIEEGLQASVAKASFKLKGEEPSDLDPLVKAEILLKKAMEQTEAIKKSLYQKNPTKRS